MRVMLLAILLMAGGLSDTGALPAAGASADAETEPAGDKGRKRRSGKLETTRARIGALELSMVKDEVLIGVLESDVEQAKTSEKACPKKLDTLEKKLNLKRNKLEASTASLKALRVELSTLEEDQMRQAALAKAKADEAALHKADADADTKHPMTPDAEELLCRLRFQMDPVVNNKVRSHDMTACVLCVNMRVCACCVSLTIYIRLQSDKNDLAWKHVHEKYDAACQDGTLSTGNRDCVAVYTHTCACVSYAPSRTS